MKKFIIIARPDHGDGIIYMRQSVEVIAKNWESAYNTLRENNYIPFIDEYVPKPSRL